MCTNQNSMGSRRGLCTTDVPLVNSTVVSCPPLTSLAPLFSPILERSRLSITQELRIPQESQCSKTLDLWRTHGTVWQPRVVCRAPSPLCPCSSRGTTWSAAMSAMEAPTNISPRSSLIGTVSHAHSSTSKISRRSRPPLFLTTPKW